MQSSLAAVLLTMGRGMAHQEINQGRTSLLREKKYGRARARETEADTGNPAFLGRHGGRRVAAAALRRLRQCLFPAAPGFTPPYAIAVVELEEGPRMMSNIIDCPQTPEALELDMKLERSEERREGKSVR